MKRKSIVTFACFLLNVTVLVGCSTMNKKLLDSTSVNLFNKEGKEIKLNNEKSKILIDIINRGEFVEIKGRIPPMSVRLECKRHDLISSTIFIGPEGQIIGIRANDPDVINQLVRIINHLDKND